MIQVVRFNGKWYKVCSRPYEPERQTFNIAYRTIQGVTPEQAYREWYSQERKDSKLLYPVFRKDA